MKQPKNYMSYETPSDADIMAAFINKSAYNRSEARKIKRELRKLKIVY